MAEDIPSTVRLRFRNCVTIALQPTEVEMNWPEEQLDRVYPDSGGGFHRWTLSEQ